MHLLILRAPKSSAGCHPIRDYPRSYSQIMCSAAAWHYFGKECVMASVLISASVFHCMMTCFLEAVCEMRATCIDIRYASELGKTAVDH